MGWAEVDADRKHRPRPTIADRFIAPLLFTFSQRISSLLPSRGRICAPMPAGRHPVYDAFETVHFLAFPGLGASSRMSDAANLVLDHQVLPIVFSAVHIA